MDIKRDGNTLTITVPLGPGIPSSTGKTNLLFSTGGFMPIDTEGTKVNLMVIVPRKK